MVLTEQARQCHMAPTNKHAGLLCAHHAQACLPALGSVRGGAAQELGGGGGGSWLSITCELLQRGLPERMEADAATSARQHCCIYSF